MQRFYSAILRVSCRLKIMTYLNLFNTLTYVIIYDVEIFLVYLYVEEFLLPCHYFCHCGNAVLKLFLPEMRCAFAEDNFATPTYKCTTIRVPMAYTGVTCSLQKVHIKHNIPTISEIYDFAHSLFQKVQLSSECGMSKDSVGVRVRVTEVHIKCNTPTVSEIYDFAYSLFQKVQLSSECGMSKDGLNLRKYH